MDRKIIIGIVVMIVVVLALVLGYFLLNNASQKESSNSSKDGSLSDEKASDGLVSGGKTLVVYYSATGSTKKVALDIAKNLDADVFEIVPKDVYTSDDLNWSDSGSRVSLEHDDESLRNVELKSTEVSNWASYDTVLIGYPIWWGIAAWPVNNFVKANDFSGKKVILFCTSASSDIGESGELLKEMANGGEWQKGKRFSSGASSLDIKKWTDGLK